MRESLDGQGGSRRPCRTGLLRMGECVPSSSLYWVLCTSRNDRALPSFLPGIIEFIFCL